MLHFRYSFWDGTQEPFAVDPDEVMDELSEELFHDGNVQRALQRLMQRGMMNRDGQRNPGIRDLLEQLKARRQEQLEQYPTKIKVGPGMEIGLGRGLLQPGKGITAHSKKLESLRGALG